MAERDDREATKAPPKAKTYKYSVDGVKLESEQASLTGAAIKTAAKVDPSFGLFLEGRGNRPDRQIGDAEVVDLSQPGQEDFYTAPGATFGDPS